MDNKLGELQNPVNTMSMTEAVRFLSKMTIKVDAQYKELLNRDIARREQIKKLEARISVLEGEHDITFTVGDTVKYTDPHQGQDFVGRVMVIDFTSPEYDNPWCSVVAEDGMARTFRRKDLRPYAKP